MAHPEEGINALRQQLKDDIRIHGITTHVGDAPNIIPEYAKARFYIWAAKREDLNEVTAKVKRLAEGAALVTGAKLNVIAFQNEDDNLLVNDVYNQVFREYIPPLINPLPSDRVISYFHRVAKNVGPTTYHKNTRGY